MILYCLLSAWINAIASLVLGATVYFKNPRDPCTVTFGAVTLSVAIWSALYALWQVSTTTETALLLARWFSAAAVLIPALYFHFTTKLTGRERPLETRVGYLLSVPLFALSFSSWVVDGVRPRLMFPHWPTPGPLYPVYLCVFFYFLLRSWQLLYAEMREASFLRRNQLRYVLAFTVAGFVGGATNFPLWYGVPVPPVGNILVGAYMIGVGYAVVRFRLMEFDQLLARAVVYGLLVLAAGMLVPYLATASGLLSVGESGFIPVYFIFVLLAGLIFWNVPRARRGIDALLEQRLEAGRLRGRETLRALAARLSSARDEAGMFEEAVAGVRAALDVADVAIYTRTEFETNFTRRAFAGRGELPEGFPESSALSRLLQERRASVWCDEVVHGSSDLTRAPFASLREHGLELAVPVMGDTLFYGFLALGPWRCQSLYSDAELSLLETVALQIGLNLRARQLERRSSQTEKLIALGTLAAGLAHELRNPLTSVQTFAALLDEQRPDPDMLKEFGAVVRRDVARIAGIVENVSAFAASNEVELTRLDLAEVLRAAVEIVHAEAERLSARIEMPRAAETARVRANHGQLLQVFVNLLQNALQAFGEGGGGRISLRIERQALVGGDPMVCVVVEDNGPGIDAALLPRVFEPFTTTKNTGARRGRQGMGLGLAIVKRIVQNHGGEIRVASAPGQGAVFRVFFPQDTSPS